MGRSRAHPINTLEPLAGGPALSGPTSNGPTSNGPTPTLAALSRDYQYDPLGQLVAIDHNTQQFVGLNAPQPQTTRYHYDAAHRLVGAQYSDGHLQTWQFDPAGNRLPDTPTHASAHLSPQGSHTDTWLQRTAPTAAAATQHRYWPDNRIHQTTTEVNGQQQTQTITYDAWGNIRRIHTTSGPHQGQTLDLLYDGLHQLRASQLFEPDAVLTGASPMANPLQGNTQGAGKTTTTFYDYDPLGRRISKTVVDQTPEKKRSIKERHWFGWDGDRLVTTETHSATHKKAISTVYEPGSFVPLLRLQTEFSGKTKSTPSKAQVLHYHCNHIGTPEALIDLSGKIVWQAQLDPWGNTRSEYNPHNIQQPIRMQGQQWDEETGLFYNRHRYYQPLTGRYINQDPIGLWGGSNNYIYPSNPIQSVDPTGTAAFAALLPAAIEATVAWLASLGGTAVTATATLSGAVVVASIPGSTSKITADSLSAAHKAAAGDRTKPGYGGNCTPDEHDKRRDKIAASCKSGQKHCSALDSPSTIASKKAALQQCFDARKDMMDTCFMGGIKHINQQ